MKSLNSKGNAPTWQTKLSYTCTLGVLLAIAGLSQQYSRGILKETYSPYIAVLFAELFKVIFSLTYIVYKKHDIMEAVRQSTPLAVPALVYFIQNALSYWIYASGISAGEVSVLLQSKILTTAILRTFFLKEHLSSQKWRSLAIISFAGCMVAEGVAKAKSGDKNSSATSYPIYGVIGCLVSALTSAIAGVILEFLFKKPTVTKQTEMTDIEKNERKVLTKHVDDENVDDENVDDENVDDENVDDTKTGVTVTATANDRLLQVAIKNFQLGIYSVVFGCFALLTFDFEHTRSYGIFHGITITMFIGSLTLAVAGLYVGLIIRELDVNFKNLATVVEILINTTCSVVLFQGHLTTEFVFGAPIIILSVFSFSLAN
jgi:drug/metabolite transporter (DMT)-like permease